jgi:hypothetical protein
MAKNHDVPPWARAKLRGNRSTGAFSIEPQREVSLQGDTLMRALIAGLAGSALMLTVSPALAQNSGLVVVDLSNSDVLNNLAQNLKVNVSDIQALNNVSIPIGLAAAVCDVNANVLAKQKKNGTPTCEAQNSTAALQRAVKQKLNSPNTQ